MTRSLPNTWLGRRGVILMRRLVTPRLRGQPVDVEALGARLRVYPYNNICEKRLLYAPRQFDPVELEMLAARIRPGFTFLDIGANIGAYSLFVAARADRDARIVALEPQPPIYERLVQNIRLNGFFNVKALDCAVADKAGEVSLFVDPRNSGESSLKIVPPEAGSAIRVTAITLLDLIRSESLERIDAMKLDVEGAEDLILEPFLRDAPPEVLPGLIVLENGEGRWQIDLVRLLADHGYRRLATTRMNLVFERRNPAQDTGGTT